MRNYKKYRSTVIDLFLSFLAGKIDKKELISKLFNEVEQKINLKSAKSLKGTWFRFFKGDTGATTLRNLYGDIDCPTNDKFIRECMQIAIDNPKGLQIYYS